MVLRMAALAGAAWAGWHLGLLGAGRSLQTVRRSSPLMGTVLNLTVCGPDRDGCEEAVDRTIAAMQHLEARFSRHQENSELSRLNRTGSLDQASRELVEVLKLAKQISTQSSGAFDVTVLPLLGVHQDHQGPDGRFNPRLLTGVRRLVDYRKVHLDGRRVQLTEPGMAISLDGIAKGAIVDCGTATLKGLGFANVCVEAGGDLMVSGNKQGTTPWKIGIRPPRPQRDARIVTVAVSDRAVATSGDYLQPFTADLKNHHILDPRSGFSPPELASCTVTAPNVALADGLATALMVLGRKDGLELIETLAGCEAYLIDKNLNAVASSGFFS